MDELFDGKYVSVVLSKVISLKAARNKSGLHLLTVFKREIKDPGRYITSRLKHFSPLSKIFKIILITLRLPKNDAISTQGS